MILCKASQTAISKAVCYKTKNEQLREKAVHFLLVAINCFYAGLPTVFCTITGIKANLPSILYAMRHSHDSEGRKAIPPLPQGKHRLHSESRTVPPQW